MWYNIIANWKLVKFNYSFVVYITDLEMVILFVEQLPYIVSHHRRSELYILDYERRRKN